MRKRIGWIGRIGLIGLIGMMACASRADIPILILQVTNAAGTADGETLTINGAARMFTNNTVASPGTLIAATNAPGPAATNIYRHLATYSPANINSVRMTNAASIELRGKDGTTIACSIGGIWGIGILATQAVNVAGNVIETPPARYAPATRTNIADDIIEFLRYAGTNKFLAANRAFSDFVSLYACQVLSNKTFYATTNNSGCYNGGMLIWVAGSLTNPVLHSPKFTNAANYGNGFVSRGPGDYSEQIGESYATGWGSVAIGHGPAASGYGALGIGLNAEASGSNSISIGNQSFATNAFSIALGAGARALHSNAFVLGSSAVSSAPDEGTLGNSSHRIKVPGEMNVHSLIASNLVTESGALTNVVLAAAAATITNLQAHSGNLSNVSIAADSLAAANLQAHGGWMSNVWLLGCAWSNTTLAGSSQVAGDWSWGRSSISSLAPGNNILDPSNYVSIELSGPGGPKTIAGILGGRNGRTLNLYNKDGQAMTFASESGYASAAAQRLVTPAGTDMVFENKAVITLEYSSSLSRWVLGPSSGTNVLAAASLGTAQLTNVLTIITNLDLPPTPIYTSYTTNFEAAGVRAGDAILANWPFYLLTNHSTLSAIAGTNEIYLRIMNLEDNPELDPPAATYRFLIFK